MRKFCYNRAVGSCRSRLSPVHRRRVTMTALHQNTVAQQCPYCGSDCPVPFGECHCGCGQKPSVPSRTDRSHDMIKGFPRKYVYGHHGDTKRRPPKPRKQKPFRTINFELTPSDLSRFWAKVDKTPGHGPKGECWIWTAATIKSNGYGVFGLHPHYSAFLAHRVSWFIAHGSLPTDRLILHHCDNPPCIRPEHLFEGDQSDNMRDCAAKNRTGTNGLYGEMQGFHKLTEREVLEIRALHEDKNRTYAATARQYGVNAGTISQVVRRLRWTHI
jgi:HNH endonuclease